MFIGHRSNDAVLTICQNNAAQSIEIRDANVQAEGLLGYTREALIGKRLDEFLPPRISELLKEYVEYQDDANDVGAVLAKVQNFSIVAREGKETGFHLKVVRSEALNRNAHFKLILQDKAGQRRTEAFRAILQENFKGHEVLDPATGLPDRYSIDKDLELVLYYVNKGDLKACFAVLELDHQEDLTQEHGEGVRAGLLRYTAKIARQNLRGDDTIGCIGPFQLGLILMDTTMESARMVLNRLRWLLNANPYPREGKAAPIAFTVSIAFSPVGERVSDRLLLPDCEQFLDGIRGKGGNVLVDVPDSEKRAGEDRRKAAISVPAERRKGPRRSGDNLT